MEFVILPPAATSIMTGGAISCRTVKGSGSSSRKKMETADDHEYCYYYYEEQASSVAVGALTMANTGHRRVLGCRKGEERRGGGEGSWFLARSLQSVGTLHVGFSSQCSPSSLILFHARLHVHQLELEKTNLLLPGTLYPLQEVL
uniref:Uncharacterized protein n=1 Tax=Oryza sativa subsp. japonica TaxID=39947 RepID=Q2QSV8_ORYSJ|nr:hypothetical protein LOC_Os12g22770 [Oryza sativa Japonica Group]